MVKISETYYRRGLVFKAKKGALGHQEICRGLYRQIANDGAVISEQRMLVAEFAVHRGEYTYKNPETLNDERAADMSLGWCDLDSQAEQKNWDDDEKETVARHMLRMLNQPGVQFELWTSAPAAKPVPTYDELHHRQVPPIAAQLGLVPEFLAYEKENKNRPEVVEKLEALVRGEEPVEELTAA